MPFPKFVRAFSFIRKTVLSVVLLFTFGVSLQAVAAGLASMTGWSEVSFTGTFPQVEPEEVKWRLHSIETPKPLDIARERFRLFVPDGYKPSRAWGLLVWVDAGNAPNIPAAWEKVLSAKRLLFVAGIRSGNSRDIFDRMRMAIHASEGIRARFKVDSERVYAAGFSGGGRVAGMLGIAWPDFFSGSLPMMGVNFFTNIPSSKGTMYPPDFIPDDQALEIARNERKHVLVTGEKDFNRGDILSVFENGYRKQRFQKVSILEIPGAGHSLPDAVWFEKAVVLLDGDGARH
jgi:hypothetical protein